MPIAFVIVDVELGTEEAVIKEVKKLKYVIEVYAVFGIYDIIAKVEAETMDELRFTVFSNIRKISNVRSTRTLTVC